ncbi:transporter substrate-binding domain-containing protein [Nodularia spumigena CS-584]|jgi:polar amino acid transport system substrate-binding protein|uniref:Transporter substrate-binding domain-containing protein n=1 Tax=Nodularia spumigena UHCC 0060 TaxID=3110300 RepID=A0ABU5URS6_NODSP|nr:transporter substrate-binding domain-containing protein [Nodularia spumigena]AHJ30391.1 putative ligand gated channel (GIC family) [Nodularia spumigena CCY9414]EAW46993.1 possible ligand gated channel (GIC family) [Nodularia spumigena CCY9414]MDB9383452.1 transporter substrate-binding domain-containing protein [Nodularia spumigena CS-584]MEA5526127.1 transporter substrate-binding domain-containing protein [Nodularia spumigena UHCC 0143]MEA5608986.1 transporter substrate-binding domain-conta
MNFRNFPHSQQIHRILSASIFHLRLGFAANHNCLTGVAVALVISVPTLASAAPLRVGVAGSAPFVVRKDKDTSGISVEVWKQVARSQKIEYELIPQASVANALEVVEQGELDLLIGPITITAQRLQKVDFTQPYFSTEIAVLTTAEDPSIWSRVKPFFETAVLTSMGILVILMFVVGNLVWLAERNKNSEQFPKNYLQGVGNGMWFALVTLTTVGYGDRAPVTRLGRLIAGTWMVLALVTVSSLTAGLASAITIALSGDSTEQFTSPSSLQDTRLATVKGSSSVEVVQNYSNRIQEVATLGDAVKLLSTKSADAVVFDRPALEYYLTQNPELNVKLTNLSLGNELYGFVLPIDSSLTKKLNIELRLMSENGSLKDIATRWLSYTSEDSQNPI